MIYGLSILWFAAQSNDRERGYDVQLGFRHTNALRLRKIKL
jgi:hypothetical protein